MSPARAAARLLTSAPSSKPPSTGNGEVADRRQEVAAAAFHAAFVRRVGRGREWSTPALAVASGIAERQLRAYAAGESQPTVPKFVVLCTIFGAEFATEVLSPAGLSVSPVEGETIPGGDALAGAADFTATLAAAMADGRIDHREKRCIVESARTLTHTLDGLVIGLGEGA